MSQAKYPWVADTVKSEIHSFACGDFQYAFADLVGTEIAWVDGMCGTILRSELELRRANIDCNER